MCHALAQQKVTQSLHGIVLCSEHGIDHIVFALGHLLPIHRPVRVHVQLLRRLQAGCDQKGRPIDAMEFKYILANDLLCRRPVCAKLKPEEDEINEALCHLPAHLLVGIAQRAEIIDQRIEPNINSLRAIVRHGYGPVYAICGTGDRDIGQRLGECVEQYLLELGWTYASVLLHPMTHVVLELRQAKHVIYFLCPFDGMPRFQGITCAADLVQTQLRIGQKGLI